MKSFFVVLALVAIACGQLPIYDNSFVEVDIPKGTGQQYVINIPYQYFADDYYYLMLNVSLGTLTDAYHDAYVYITNDVSNPTQNFVAHYSHSFKSKAIDFPSYYTCNTTTCRLYLFVNATCSTCYKTVTTGLSLAGVTDYYWPYQPIYYPIYGYGYMNTPPVLVEDYATIAYPTTKVWQYFTITPTANFTSPVTIFPSALAEPVFYTVYGCQGVMPANVTQYCGAFPGWKQGRKGTQNFPPGVTTYVAVAMTIPKDLYYGTYMLGLSSGAASLAVSSLFLVLLALLLL
jgi:hypothetical protein